MHAIANKP
jgi:hypothetical protein